MKETLMETGKSLAEALIIVAMILLVAYAATGSWHIGFAVESGSMVPNMEVGDLIFVLSPHRTNITTHDEGTTLDYKSFKNYGDVIIYRPKGLNSTTPIIHRAMYWVETGEKMPGGKPAPHAGYITKGDNNPGYDQQSLPIVVGVPVKPEWVVAVAKVRVPYLGYPSLILKDTTQKIKGFVNKYRG
ncbi:signal peptidase, endoplasmic reticulum-type [Candidatus Methanophagaceae archaeon]|nr:signal peptidase, endoplasmic reticulum-type [Methanophagales archaeon]